jgi:hypothetical protein
MMFRPSLLEELTGMPAFNAGTSSGVPEEMYRLVRNANIRPNIVLMGLDIEMFHDQDAVENDLQRSWSNVTQLLSIEQSSLSLQLLQMLLRGKRPVAARHLDADGYLHYDNYEAEARTGAYDLSTKLQRTTTEYRFRWEGFSHISQSRLQYVEAIMRFCKEQNIQMVVVLTPYHPLLKESLPSNRFNAMKNALWVHLSELCSRYGAQCKDYTSIETFNADDRSFYDGVHMNERNTDALVRSLFSSTRNHAVQ